MPAHGVTVRVVQLLTLLLMARQGRVTLFERKRAHRRLVPVNHFVGGPVLPWLVAYLRVAVA